MELAQKTNTTAIEVQPHNEQIATKESPQQSIVDIKERRQQQQQQQNRKSKSTTPQPLDESAEDINWPRLAVSSDEEEKKIVETEYKQKRLIEKVHENTTNNNDIKTQVEEVAAVEKKEEEEEAEKEHIFELDEFVAKRKRYEVSRLGSEEFLLGCDEADGEARLVSESADLIEYNNMADSKNVIENNLLEETYAPAAKRLKKSPEKFSPRREETKRQTSRQEQAHVVGDAEETRHQNHTSLTKTRGIGSNKHTLNAAKPLSAQDDFYKKPFEYGWKRELVWRATPESGRERADVYFISPAGKKIRTRHDILPLLQGDLKMEHFCWLREAVGVGPEYETVRNAKPNPNRASTAAAITLATIAIAAPTPVPGKRTPKPKMPKGASPPPEGWTPTRALKVNNAALNSRSTSYGGFGGSVTPSSRATSNTATRSSSNKKKPTINATQAVVSQPISGGGNNLLDKMVTKEATMSITEIKHQKQNQNNQKTIIDGNIIKSTSHASSNRQGCEPCTIMCSLAPGLIPQLQCVKCLCLYHHQCVGLNPNTTIFRRSDGSSGRDYICESCNPKLKTEVSPKKLSTTTVVNTSTTTNTTAAAATNNVKTPFILKDKKSIAKNVTNTANLIKSTSSPASSRGSVNSSNNKRNNNNNNHNKLPQSIAVVKGKKYVVVEKTRNKSKQQNEYANDIENDLKQINESIRNSLPIQPALAKLEAAQLQQQQQNAIALSATMQQHYARNVFANMSYTFDSLLIILKYLKIHERMRFASVCKMWHAAANSRFVWQTVRLKNSKVYNWSGCAAALQRNGTKHLDMRKMLFPNARADETWTDFSKHIVQACFLETIDLCRCPARVVESLFSSNQNLRVLNAITINDDAINLENINKLTNLEELRLRTNEPAVLTNDLQPLSTLTKLTHLSITGIRSLGNKHVESLENLISLRNLELGECGALSETFAQVVLTKLKQLQRLRLENGQDTTCDTLSILEAITTLPQLNQLELVNFDVRPGFEERLKQCLALNKLLIIPTYLSQSATTNQTVLEAVQGIASQLKVFTWGVTVELLRVTALYVDQCDESSKKEKHNFDECIPVLKPVPGASAIDGHDTDMDNSGSTNNISTGGETEANVNNDVPQIEILPLDKVERILAANIANTKFQIVKVPYHATCKQQLVE